MASIIDNEEAQIYGMASIGYYVDMDSLESNMTPIFAASSAPMVSLPFRLCAINFCLNNARFQGFLQFVQMVMRKINRVKFQCHFGSPIEIQYSLLACGIPEPPVNMDGTLKMDLYEQYLRETWEKESKMKETTLVTSDEDKVLYPSPKDVLLGRGKPFQEFPGNLRMMEHVDFYRLQYIKTDERLEKSCISSIIVKQLQESGTRFLQRTKEGWEVVDFEVARAKVSKALRTKHSSSAPVGN